jgi:hypothetical protein
MIPSCVYAIVSLLGLSPVVDRRHIGEQGAITTKKSFKEYRRSNIRISQTLPKTLERKDPEPGRAV